MLAEQAEFYPFVGSITPDGTTHQRGRQRLLRPPEVSGAYRHHDNEFRSQASEGKIRAAGICFDVRIVPPGQVDKTDAIQLALERKGGDAVDVFVPYAQLPDGGVYLWELFACERAPTFFVPAASTDLTKR
jgi:hypothetical protein